MLTHTPLSYLHGRPSVGSRISPPSRYPDTEGSFVYAEVPWMSLNNLSFLRACLELVPLLVMLPELLYRQHCSLGLLYQTQK